MVDLGVLVVLFIVLIFGLGPSLVPQSLGSPLCRVTVGIAASMVLLYLLGFGIYLLALPPSAHWAVLAATAIAAGTRWRQLTGLWGDRDVRYTALAWAAVATWVVGWQFMVFSYSGSTWEGDCYEHFERSRFFLKHWDVNHRFLGTYSIAARPPLVNIVTSVFRALAGGKFYVYQVVCSLLASLVVWPTCLLQHRFARAGSRPRIGWLALLLFALPALAQNAAFTWTKLPTVFFILTGLALLCPRSASFPLRLAGWLSLTAGMLAHYSTGPWIVAIGVAELVRGSSRWRTAFSRQTGLVMLACGLLFSTWLGWSWVRLGAAETFGSNTTVTDGSGKTWGQRFESVAANLYYTAVPVLFRDVDYGGYTADAAVVRVRDRFFDAVQSSALMIAGSLGVIVAAILLWVERRTLDWSQAPYWSVLLAVAVVLGIAVHTEVIVRGVGQICLLPFAFVITAWLAARIPETPRLRWLLGAGLSVDFTLGIALHFLVQSLWLARWQYPDATDFDLIQLFGHGARSNLQSKTDLAQRYLYDLSGAPVATGLLLGVAVVLLVQCFRAPPSGATARSAA